jgi:hypothetical protein
LKRAVERKGVFSAFIESKITSVTTPLSSGIVAPRMNRLFDLLLSASPKLKKLEAW